MATKRTVYRYTVQIVDTTGDFDPVEFEDTIRNSVDPKVGAYLRQIRFTIQG